MRIPRSDDAESQLAKLVPRNLHQTPCDPPKPSLWHGARKYIDQLTGTTSTTPFDSDPRDALPYNSKHYSTVKMMYDRIPVEYQMFEDVTPIEQDKPMSTLAEWAAAYIQDLIAARRPPSGPAQDAVGAQLANELATHVLAESDARTTPQNTSAPRAVIEIKDEDSSSDFAKGGKQRSTRSKGTDKAHKNLNGSRKKTAHRDPELRALMKQLQAVFRSSALPISGIPTNW